MIPTEEQMKKLEAETITKLRIAVLAPDKYVEERNNAMEKVAGKAGNIFLMRYTHGATIEEAIKISNKCIRQEMGIVNNLYPL